MNKKLLLILFSLLILLLLLTACQHNPTVCTPGSIQYAADRSLLPAPVPGKDGQPGTETELLEINGRAMEVDAVLQGPLCDAHLSGTVYIGCDIEVIAWEQYPKFLETCDFSVEDGSVVYVAWHNDAAYYKGCSCHITGEEAGIHE
jgi:hypothetical protein